MHTGLKLLLGLILLTGCKQSISMPDQDFLVSMGTLDYCWRGNDGANRCNCMVEKVRNRYHSASQLDDALDDPMLRTQAQITIQSAVSSCSAP
ncbi:MAG: hypothetical protein ACAI44_17590 [Candidatus Sericytochromatia bacterium]